MNKSETSTQVRTQKKIPKSKWRTYRHTAKKVVAFLFAFHPSTIQFDWSASATAAKRRCANSNIHNRLGFVLVLYVCFSSVKKKKAFSHLSLCFEKFSFNQKNIPFCIIAASVATLVQQQQQKYFLLHCLLTRESTWLCHFPLFYSLFFLCFVFNIKAMHERRKNWWPLEGIFNETLLGAFASTQICSSTFIIVCCRFVAIIS